MQIYHFFDLVWLFFLYSFAGWVLETVLATIRQKSFVNRGLINGPLCIIYGFTAVFITFVLGELDGFFLFFYSMIWATVIEWSAGHLIEKFFKERWWDYSKIKWNFDGYVCLPVSIVWGILGYLTVRFGNKIFLDIKHLLPELLINLLLLILLGILAVDVLASYLLLRKLGDNLDKWEEANDRIASVSEGLTKWITTHIMNRVRKAYPGGHKTKTVEIKEEGVFAQGCCFEKIFLLFVIGSFLGDITETIYCRIRGGIWMSRSSVVWGPFSIVWGLAIALVTWMLYRYKEKGERFLFLLGTFLGGAYEYLCSVFTEIVFGKVFWDYSQMPFNLGGRINLLYCFFWGIAAVVWFKHIYPYVEKWIEKIPVLYGKIATGVLVLFFVCNIAMSCLALIRYDERSREIAAENALMEWVDEHFDDTKMKKIYPNAMEVKDDETENTGIS